MYAIANKVRDARLGHILSLVWRGETRIGCVRYQQEKSKAIRKIEAQYHLANYKWHPVSGCCY